MPARFFIGRWDKKTGMTKESPCREDGVVRRLLFEETQNRKNEENDEAHLCDGGCDSFNAAETEESGDQGDDDKYDGITKHDCGGVGVVSGIGRSSTNISEP